MTQQLNYAVFGLGRIGRVHAAIVAEQGHSIVAIGDEVDGAIDLTRHVLNLPAVPTFKSPQAMIEAMGEAIDAVIIEIPSLRALCVVSIVTGSPWNVI